MDRGRSGTTLAELMVALIVISVAALSLMAVFGGVSRGIQFSKFRTLATNLAQEKIQILKQKSYYRVFVTTAAAYRNDFSPAVPYDLSYNSPETFPEGGISFTRLTYVELAQEVSGNIQPVPPTSPDTNMKLITVTVIWTEGARNMKLQVRNVMSNPDALVASSVLRGQVTSGGPPLANALVTVAEVTGWQDTTDLGGDYTLNLYAGNYNLTCSAQGHFPQTVPVTVTAAGAVTQNFALTAMASKTLTGQVWKNDRLVISQVVGGVDNPAGFSQEYVEIHNPTTWTWTVSGALGLKFQRRTVQDPSPLNIAINYAGSPATIAPGAFYLYANTAPVHVAGGDVAPDAVWNAAPGGPNEVAFNNPPGRFVTTPGAENYNIIPVDGDSGGGHAAGGLQLIDAGTGQVLDRVGWNGNGGQSPGPDVYETAPIAQAIGLEENEVYQRLSSTAGVSAVWGPAYDSGNSPVDWSVQASIPAAPRTTAAAPLAVAAGTPAVGAVASANDGFSVPVQAQAAGSPPTAQFNLPNVATGTWTVFVASGSHYQEISDVVVGLGGGTQGVPDSATLPPWTVPAQYSIFLSATTDEGFVAGTVKNVLNAAIAPAITVTNGARSTTAATTGSGAYLLRTPAETFTVSANPGNLNPDYITASSAAVTVAAGQVTSNVNFVLSQGGQLSGFVTRDGVNPLPGCAVMATNSVGLVSAQEVTGSDGRFRMVDMATGTYTVEPVLGSGETSTPTGLSPTVTIGAEVVAGTFTVQGASGFIRGSASAGGKPVETGVMLVASTATIAGGPPNLSAATLSGAAYYTASTSESGTYTLEVRGSTTTLYKVYAYYPVRAGNAWVINGSTVTGINVTPGQTTTGVNFAW